MTHLIGRPLVGLNFRQQRFEADFRFNLVRVRENSEQIALLRGEDAERERLLVRFGRVVDNWLAIMSRTKRLTAFTASYTQASVVFPYVLVAPAYFARQDPARRYDADRIGVLERSGRTFILHFHLPPNGGVAGGGQPPRRVRGRDWRGAQACTGSDRIHVVEAAGGGAIDLKGLALRLPNGTPLVNAEQFSLRKRRTHADEGPSGSGKSTLFRAIAGIWPFGAARSPSLRRQP